MASTRRRKGVDHRVVKSNEDNTFNLEEFERECANAGNNLKMVSLSHVGNLDGIATPVKQACKNCKGPRCISLYR